MKAAVVENIRFANVKEVEEPEVKEGSIKVKVEACAICGSDLRLYTKGDHRAQFPIIMGHEIAGTIVEIGEGTQGFSIGQRVCVAPGHGCGKCKFCKNGMENICSNPIPSIGFGVSGGFAQYMVPPALVVKGGFVNTIPANLSFEEASMSELLACCINAQERIHVGKDDNVLIMGPGPAGCMHVQLAKSKGAKKVMICGHSSNRLMFVKENLNADLVLMEQGEELTRRVMEETEGMGADVIIVAAPSHVAQEHAVQMIAPRGRINFFGGLPKSDCHSNIDANMIHYKECSIVGSSSSLARHNKEALQLISENKITAKLYITHRFSIDEFSEALEKVERKETIKAIIAPWKSKE